MTGKDLAGARRQCAEQLRRSDRDRYLIAQTAPAGRRGDLFALYAFNQEIAKTAEVVSEPMIGRIRLQWWREAIAEACAGKSRDHAVLIALAAAIRDRGLTPGHFARLIDARDADLDSRQPGNLAELEAYCRDTSAPLISLALEVLGQTAESAHALTEPLGTAWALTGLLRALPFHARRKRLLLPGDMINIHSADARALFELQPTAKLKEAVETLAVRAEALLSTARHQRPKPPKAAHPALLLAILAQGYLETLRRAGYDPFDARVQRRDASAAWRLTWARLRGTF